MDVLKAWDYAQTIYYSEKLQIAYIKVEKDTRKHICSYFEGQEVNPQGPFGQTKLYFEPEKHPAGAFWANKIAFSATKSSRRGLLGKIFDKLRIRGRMQFLNEKSQKALNHVLIGLNDRSRCDDFAGIFIVGKGVFCVELRPFY